ncbi:uncharacterized protein ACLA_094150 [Aspergillus clavatus NRRL 1]|uniref:Uncharacterized protein n=1 Tax=Aspergillus clavatus (strain ATCC 1007 / CBS 513.65 / DSM 816 / NCTC 3887 / NRRL 1 / QM 1276 / 107) TaxID=344612 RepID=A1CFR7_ASPCL|nr:uncharacterized protein ACLA_094150 [Aspergillus clavatus NRRL 1]EAW11716.1 conserved hypothetical protein [Aspergillus clavatus NRRL 1]
MPNSARCLALSSSLSSSNTHFPAAKMAFLPPNMANVLLLLLGVFLLVAPSLAVVVSEGSPCLVTCGGTAKTENRDLICKDADYNTTAEGIKMKNCLLCESTSTTYRTPYDSDIYWFIFNQKYTLQVCVFEASTSAALSPCETQCLPLKPVFKTLWWGNHVSLYDYCTQNNNAFLTYAADCAACLRGKAGTVSMGNFMDNMSSACKNQPNATKGETVDLPRPIFDLSVASTSTSSSTTATKSTTDAVPTTGTTAAATPTAPSSASLSTGASAGIGVGAGVGVILAGALIWLLMRRRRRAQAHQPVELHETQQMYWEPASPPPPAPMTSRERSRGPVEAPGAEMKGAGVVELPSH